MREIRDENRFLVRPVIQSLTLSYWFAEIYCNCHTKPEEWTQFSRQV